MILSNARAGWQTTLADLALILFMVTAAAMAERPEAADPAEAASPVPARGEPLAIYRAAPGAPPLADWLAEQPHDARQNLTIVARYAAGRSAETAAAAVALASEAGAAGRNARIVVEPAQTSDLVAVLDFDGRTSGTGIAETPARPAPRAPQESDIGR
ncbi:hypothetical protein [Pelagerythrobacter rhizovicinus]|uniref:Uncharacterized protein n=1 Tax=Pelagerythrobacter rhizovicinus TaxID=2268576 RepID=A0A4V1QW80_9SPHN|nr:hypothetical protein [Pelagerythrobacter rhizovicinus]RXZ65226.1 hypothetical protein ETX26_00215 [Pelagerythrobacter rhizovicinus]